MKKISKKVIKFFKDLNRQIALGFILPILFDMWKPKEYDKLSNDEKFSMKASFYWDMEEKSKTAQTKKSEI